MSRRSGLYAYVNEEGYLILPPDVAERCGLKPGLEIDLREGTYELSVRPPLLIVEDMRRTHDTLSILQPA